MPGTVPRDTERHPREARIPAGTDPSGNASANDIPDVEIEEPTAAPPSEPHTAPLDQTSGPSSISTAALPAAAPHHATPSTSGPPSKVKSTRRRGRGPDIIPRFPQPELPKDSNKTDWSTFQIDKSLRVLRHGTEEQQPKEVRKLHLDGGTLREPQWSGS